LGRQMLESKGAWAFFTAQNPEVARGGEGITERGEEGPHLDILS